MRPSIFEAKDVLIMKSYSRSEFIKFFTDRVKGEKKACLRPPYNDNPEIFEKVCPSCAGLCARICEEQIIEIGEEGTPVINLKKGGCTFCRACLDVCEKDVLNLKEDRFIKAKIHLNFTTCLAWNETVCQSCKEACTYDAILFDGLKKPNIRKDECNRCGICVPVCPEGSINIFHL